MKYGVITAVPPPGDRGNLALTIDLYLDPQAIGGSPMDDPQPLLAALGLPPIMTLYVQAPVFRLGELLVCDDSGRELAGLGRKPSKWAVSVEWFDDVTAAIERADVARRETEEELISSLGDDE